MNRKRLLLEERVRRARQQRWTELDAALAGAFKEQLAFILDPSPRKLALCGRRAGKSTADGLWLLDGARQDPGGLSVAVGITSASIRGIIWDQGLERMHREHRLGLRLTKPDGQWHIECPNGHRIWLRGCSDRAQLDALRGFKYRRAVVDEAQLYGSYLQELVEDTLDPGLADHGGELALTGTPGPVPAGYFWAASTGTGMQQWPTHHWTCVENPHFHGGQGLAFLTDKRTRLNWEPDHPTFRREWLGQWVSDGEALVYPFSRSRNVASALPEDCVYALGVDVGYEDATAFVVAAYERGLPNVYIVEARKAQHLIPSAVAARVAQYQERYRLSSIVVDEGGFGKGYAEEMRQSFQLPVKAAQKTKKRAYIELIRGDLLSGTVKVLAGACTRPLVDEWITLQWNEDRSAPDERGEDHAADAALYVLRELRPYYTAQREPPTPGTRDYYDALLEEHRARAEDEVRRILRRDWGELERAARRRW